MITVAQAVKKAVGSSPLYGEAILEEVVNYSALARKVKPFVEEILLEPITEGAITIALKRYAISLQEDRKKLPIKPPIRNISLRSDLVALIYQNSPMLQVIHQKILPMSTTDDAFVHFAQGSRESSFVVSDKGFTVLKNLAEKERIVAEYPNLSAISVRMPPEVMQNIGVFAPFVQALAWQRISVYQIVSHFTEITFIVSDQDADRALDVVKSVSRF